MQMSSSENIYNSDLPSVDTETALTPDNQTGGFLWGKTSYDAELASAIKAEKFETAKFLIEKGISRNFNVGDDVGRTALHAAVEKSKVSKDGLTGKDILSLILERADQSTVNARDNDGNTALHLATQLQDSDLCRDLIARGADSSIINNRGQIVAYEDSERMSESSAFSDAYTNTVNTEEFRRIVDTFKANEGTSDIFLTSTSSIDTNDIDTEDLQRVLKRAIHSSEQEVTLAGGAKRTRKLRSYVRSEQDDNLDRMIDNQANEIHERATKKIMELMKVDEDTAKIYKNAVYRSVRKDLPDLHYLDRAYEMEKRITKEILSKIDIDRMRTESEEIREKRQKERESRPPKEKKAKKSKGKKTDAKKADKKAEKTAEKKPAKKAAKKEKKVEETSIDTSSVEGTLNLSSTSFE